jgi:hypothetical protein
MSSRQGNTAHREAAKHREETRDWLRERERIVRERTPAAPSIVPEASEWPRRVGRTRAYSHEGRFRA